MGLDLSVGEGEFFGFIGPNGAGKSTTIRCLLGLISPSSGGAEVLGMDIRARRVDILRSVGYLPSEAVFYPGMRVGELLRFSAGLRGLDCSAEAGRLCERLELDTSRRVDELSFGNRKKAAIVCALQSRPRLLILDEPTGGLDGISEVFASMGSFTAAFGMDRLGFGTLVGFYAIECGNILGLGGAFFASLCAVNMLSKEERDRTAEFLLSHPVSRRRVVTEKLAALRAQYMRRPASHTGRGAVSLSKKVTNWWPFSRIERGNVVQWCRVKNMLVKNAENRGQLEFVSLEEMVPKDHLLRKIDAAVDFKRIYEFVEDLYCEDNGRPSVDPLVLFKIVLIQHIYGIPSLRRTLEEVSMNLAYRWFIGYPLNEAVPHFSTVSYNFKHRFNHGTVEYVFRWVLKAAAEEGYLDTEAIFVDGTHIKASANLKKQAKKAVPKQAKRYAKELFDEVNRDREGHGKKPFPDDSDKKLPEEKETVTSTTDPESGVFHKGEHKKCFAYEAHTACDKHSFVLGVHVTPGNVHDSAAFDPLYDELCQYYPEHKTVVADSAYKTPWICKRIFESGRVLSTCYTRPKARENGHPWWAYVYDEYFDDVICPEYRALHYSTTNREGYREYKSRAYLCKTCPTRGKCTESAKSEKTVLRHVWQDYVEMAEHVRHMAVYKELYRLRKEKIERVFADAKEKHGMRYTQYRGLVQVTNWVKLKFAAMNLKKLATWKWKASHPGPDGGRRTSSRGNAQDFSVIFPVVFLFTNQKPALA